MHRAAANLAIRKTSRARRFPRSDIDTHKVFAVRLIGVCCLVIFCTSLGVFKFASPGQDVYSTLTTRQPTQCRDVEKLPSRRQCIFVQQHCQNEDDGLIPYLKLYYCTFSAFKVVAWILLVPWIAILFTTIGVCAGDFFAVTLSSIARSLHMSDTLAGVTLLAVGNGGPDIFSTWAAVTSNTPELAIGELVGAASFITTVVAGSLALITPFRVKEISLVRDAFFLLLTSCLLLACLVTQELHFWQGILMISIYIVYVAVVMMYHWWTSQRAGADEIEEVGDVEDQQTTPTEHEPLLRSSHERCAHPSTQTAREVGRMSPAVYREITEWRLAHGRCIISPSVYNTQPSLLGSCEHLWQQRQQKLQKASTDPPKFATATPRSHEDDDRAMKTLFPSLHDLSTRSWWHILVNVAMAVPFLLLKLTIPVVDNEHDVDCQHGWDRWLLVLQGFVAPQLVWILLWLSSELSATISSWIVPAAYCLLGSTIFACFVFLLSSSKSQPRWYPLLSVMGFIMSVFWLSTIAEEVVAIMKALGAISGLSQAILGYTLFAVGNSLDDWVANITVSRHGHPVMALAACFGGPLLNILIGLGTCVTYVTIRDAKNNGGKLTPILFKIDYVLVVPTAVVAAVMIFVISVLRWNQWQMTKNLGIALIVVWCLLATVNVVLEIIF